MYSVRKTRLVSVPEVTPPESLGWEIVLYLSFPWMDFIPVYVNFNEYNSVYAGGFSVKFSEIPSFCFVSTLILLGGLCGLSSKKGTRVLGSFFGIIGMVSYFMLVFPKNIFPPFPYFGLGQHQDESYLRFLSVGFYLALAGSLMLLLPLVKTGVERLRKRL